MQLPSVVLVRYYRWVRICGLFFLCDGVDATKANRKKRPSPTSDDDDSTPRKKSSCSDSIRSLKKLTAFMMSLRVSIVAVIRKNSYVCGHIWFKCRSGVATKIPPINRFSKVLVLLLEKKAQKNHLTLEMQWEFHQFDAQTCDPNTWIKLISGTSSWKREQFHKKSTTNTSLQYWMIWRSFERTCSIHGLQTL